MKWKLKIVVTSEVASIALHRAMRDVTARGLVIEALLTVSAVTTLGIEDVRGTGTETVAVEVTEAVVETILATEAVGKDGDKINEPLQEVII